MRTYPVLKRLRPGCFGIRIVACTQNSDENLSIANFTCLLIDYFNSLSTVVGKYFVAGLVNLSHCNIGRPGKLPVEMAELAVAVAVRMLFDVFFPEQLQSHAWSSQLAADQAVIWNRNYRVALLPGRKKLLIELLFQH